MAEKEKVKAPDVPIPDLYATMDHGAHGDHATHQGHHEAPDAHHHMDHEANGQTPDSGHAEHMSHAKKTTHSEVSAVERLPLVDQLTVDELEALGKTEFPKTSRFHDVKLVLGGDMERYVWHINGKAIYQERTIEIKEGDVVRFTLVNETMMHHPMHLHGHFFRVQNKKAENSPLKHTVDVPPHGTRTIEFLANEPGEWMLHCHNLYHMKTGMARVVKYSSYTPSAEIASHRHHDPHLHDHLYHDGMVEIATNHAQLGFRLSKTWDTLEAHFETREYDSLNHAEGDLFYRRWFSQYFNLIAGAAHFDDETRGVIGVGYTLPMLIEANLLVDHKGDIRLDLEKKFQWTKYIFTDAEVSFRQNKKTEFEISLMYAQNWAWAAGLMFTEESVGVGAQYKF